MRWQIAIDRGGTFTDSVALDPSGNLRVGKVLSSHRATLDVIRSVMGLAADAPIPACDLRIGTTLATNALLERRGHRTALAITGGFADLLRIGTQARPDLFALDIAKPEPLPERVIEIDARLDAHGQILSRPDTTALAVELLAARGRGHGIPRGGGHPRVSEPDPRGRDRDHRPRRWLRPRFTVASGFAGGLGLLARAETTVLDAYLTPLIRDHFAALSEELPGSRLEAMQSSGGFIAAPMLRGPHAIVSGPAGGLVSVGAIARAAEVERAVGFDMGGTSTDVSRWAGELPVVYEAEHAGLRVRAPMMDIHTIAAGGGSLCRVDGGRLTVGPQSAGAQPGPLVYGHPEATELTLTDVNVVLGRLPAD